VTSFARAFIASCSLQVALLAGYMHHPAVAELFLVTAGICVVTGVQAAGGGLRARTKRRLRDALITLMLVGGVLRLIFGLFGGGNSMTPGGDGTNKSASKDNKPAEAIDRGGGDHSGVILLTETQPVTTLVPPLPSMTANLFDPKHPNPVSIPFYGAYWFFKFPDHQPPPSSYVTHGTPVNMVFRAPDQRMLFMEAHQNLGKLLNLQCCSAIRIEIRNADPFRDTVDLELVLIDTREGEQGSLSLGRAPVESVPESPNGAPVKETLTFPIPAHPSITRFDELAIRFPRRYPRADRSAKIAIERFVLVPKG
jgi:hypothetical protein